MVSCAARASIARTKMITPLQGPFTSIFLLIVSCLIIFVGPVTEKKRVIMEDDEEEVFDSNFSGHAGFSAFDDDVAMEKPKGEAAEDDLTYDLGQVLRDMREDCESENERMKFQQMLVDQHKLLYPECADGLKKLGITLELLQWKAAVAEPSKLIRLNCANHHHRGNPG
jgi:hypothetical protein